MARFLDLTGQRFGRLTVQGIAPYRSSTNKILWTCICTCGNKTAVNTQCLKNGEIQSCGCLHREGIKAGYHTIHQGAGKNERLYNVWRGMKARCLNPHADKYKEYGARGITVCCEWKNSYPSFRKWAMENGYDPKAKYGVCTLDRIDVNGPYCPENCRWADAKTQRANQRRNLIGGPQCNTI